MTWLRAGLLAAGLGFGCVLPTAVGLRHDGFVGPVGTTQGGAAYGALGFDATVATTVAPGVQLATAIGWNGLVHAQVEARIGGAVRPDEPSASLLLGASGLFDVTDATDSRGLQVGFVFAYPSGPVRFYGGLTVNPAWGNLFGATTYSLWTTPTLGVSVRNVGHDRVVVGGGVELAAQVLVQSVDESGASEGWSTAAPMLQLWAEFGRTGRGTARHPPPEPEREPERPSPPAPPPTTAKTLARLSSPNAQMWVLPAGLLDLGGVVATLDHPVAIGITEVDRETWARVANAPPSDDRRPVVGITLHDAMRFCNGLSRLEGYPEAYVFDGDTLVSTTESGGYRLPTAVEWRLAAVLVARGTREWAHTLANTPDGPEVVSAEGLPAFVGNTEEWAGDAAKGYGLHGGSWRDAGHEVGPLVVRPASADLGAAGLRVARTLPVAR